MKKLTRFLGVIVVLVLLGFTGVWLFGRNTEGKGQPKRPDTDAQLERSQYTLDQAGLSNNIQSVLDRNNDLDMGVAITDLQTGQRYHYGETASYTAASIGKLITATTYLHLVDSGQASLDDKVGGLSARTQLTKLIEKSDNAAWQTLNNTVTHQRLETFAAGLGLNSYSPATNILSSDDINLLLAKLAGQKILSAVNTEFLLSLMAAADMRSFIVAAVPDGTDVYHKVGYLDDRLHDAAIIRRDNRSYVLVIFSKSAGDYDFSRGARVFGDITEATLQAFFP